MDYEEIDEIEFNELVEKSDSLASKSFTGGVHNFVHLNGKMIAFSETIEITEYYKVI